MTNALCEWIYLHHILLVPPQTRRDFSGTAVE